MTNGVYGTDEDDVLVGDADDDSNWIYGGLGDDHLTGNILNDRLYGGDGSDTMYGLDGADLFYGSSGGKDDNFRDVMFGGAGNDTFGVTGGGHSIDGGDDIDLLTWTYEEGDFTLYLDGSGPGGMQVAGIENINAYTETGASGTLFGTDGNNRIFAGNSNDSIAGFGGDDSIEGGGGDDEIDGGSGNDRIQGHNGSDTLFGGDGNDTIMGDSADTMFGGTGDDSMHGGKFFYGGAGLDSATVILEDDVGYSIDLDGSISGGALSGGHINADVERITFLGGGGGLLVLNGTDIADQVTVFATVSVNRAVGSVMHGRKGDDTLTTWSFNRNELHGDEGNDSIDGKFGENWFFGGDGDDTIKATGHSNFVYGGDGNDIITVATRKSSDGRQGFTDVDGGDGDDTIAVSSERAKTIIGGRGNDTITAANGTDTVFGGSGADRITFYREDRSIVGGSGADTLIFDTNGLNDRNITPFITVDGGAGIDTLDIRYLLRTDSVLVDHDTNEIFVSSERFGDFTFTFKNIENFTASYDGIVTEQGTPTDLPTVEDDNLQQRSNAKFISKDFYFDGDSAFIASRFTKNDLTGVFGFDAIIRGIMDIDVYKLGNPNVKATYTIDVERGQNTINVNPPLGWDPNNMSDLPYYGYGLKLHFSSIKSPELKAIEGWIDNDLAGYLKMAVVDFKALAIDLLKLLDDNLKTSNFDEVLDGAGKRLGVLGNIIDYGTKASNISKAFQISRQEGLKQSFVELVDTFAGMAAGQAGGFAGTLVGGPVGTIIGGLAAGTVYGTQLSAAVKLEAAAFFDKQYASVHGQNAGILALGELELGALFDASDLIFDATWYASEHPDAAQAVADGEYPSLFAYYIVKGIKAGHAPNETAPVITPSDLTFKIRDYDPFAEVNTTMLKADIGTLAGDDLSKAESDMAARINDARSDSANVSADLSAVANRIALDWVQNRSQDLAAAKGVGGAGNWASELSDGRLWSNALSTLASLTAGLDGSVRLIALYDNSPNLSKIFERLTETARNADAVLGSGTQSIGVAHVAGLWIILVDTDANADDAVSSGLDQSVTVAGSTEADTVLAGLDQVTAHLLDGSDDFTGGGNDDTAFGGSGADTLTGFRGNDRLQGDRDNDLLDGGKGRDRLIGGGGDDTVLGGGGNDVVKGNSGKDFLSSGGGNDDVSGGSGSDRIVGGSGNDTLAGDGGRDKINAGGGNDVVEGGRGNDRLEGGGGNDTLTGGGGSDRFDFKGNFGDDVVTDFDLADTRERIDLSKVASVTSFSDLKNNHLSQNGADAVISTDTGTIQLLGVQQSDLSADHFVF